IRKGWREGSEPTSTIAIGGLPEEHRIRPRVREKDGRAPKRRARAAREAESRCAKSLPVSGRQAPGEGSRLSATEKAARTRDEAAAEAAALKLLEEELIFRRQHDA